MCKYQETIRAEIDPPAHFHVLQTASHNTYDLDVGVPSRDYMERPTVVISCGMNCLFFRF